MNGLITWTPGITLESIEKQVVLAAFRHYRGSKTATANALGVAIRTLDNKLAKYAEDDTKETERQINDKRKRDEWLVKSRGVNTPNNITTSIAPGDVDRTKTDGPPTLRTDAGVRVEPAPQLAEKPAMPVHERQKVQSVLPKHAPKSSAR